MGPERLGHPTPLPAATGAPGAVCWVQAECTVRPLEEASPGRRWLLCWISGRHRGDHRSREGGLRGQEYEVIGATDKGLEAAAHHPVCREDSVRRILC